MLAVQYKSDNGWSGWLLDILNAAKRVLHELPPISEEISNFFSEVQKANHKTGEGKTIVNWDYFNTKFKMTNKNVLEFQKTWDGVGNVIEEYQNYLSKVGKQTSIFTKLTKKAGSTLKTFAGTLSSIAVMWAIGEAISFVVKTIDNLVVTYKEHLELIEEAKREYEESTSTLESLDEKLTSVKNRINELNSLDKLSFTEQDELNNLQMQNDELERSIALEKEHQRLALENTVDEITSTYQSNRDKYSTNDLEHLYQDNERANEEIQSYENDQYGFLSNLRHIERTVGLAENKIAIEENNHKIELLKQELLNKSKDLEAWIKDYETKGIESLDIDEKNSYQSMKVDLDKIYQEILEPGAYFEIQLKPVFQDESLTGIQEKLTEYFSEGGTINGIKDKFGKDLIEALRKACEESGVELPKLLEHMYGEATDNIDMDAVRREMLKKFGVNDSISKDNPQKIASLTNEELQAYVELRVNPESDKWNLDEWIENIKSYIASKNETIETPFTFSEENSKAIDDFQKKMKTVSSTLESLRKNEKIDFTDLYQEFPALVDTTDTLDVALEKLVNSELKSLYQVLGSNVPSALRDALDSIAKDAVNASKGIKSISDALTALDKGQELLSSVKEAMSSSTFAGFDVSTLGKMTSAYSEMEDAVNSYVAGLISAEEVYGELEKCYQNDVKIFEASNQSKIYTNNQYYSAILNKEEAKVNELSKAYETDFKNYKNLAQAKESVEKQLLLGISSLWHKYYDIVQGSDGIYHAQPKFNTLSYESQQDPVKQELIKKANELNQFYRDLADTFNVSNIKFESSILDTVSKSGSKSTKDFENLIDWVSLSLEILQNRVTKSQETFQNTKGYDEQIVKIKDLINAQKELEKGYTKAAETYYQQYQKALNKTGMAKKVKSSIESGTKFNIEDFIDKNIESGTAGAKEKLYNSIQDAINWYNKYSDTSKSKVSIGLEISDNKLQILEVQLSKLTAEESILAEKLNSETLSYLDQIDLMGEQLAKKKEILQQELKIAKAKNDSLEVDRISVEIQNTLQHERYQQFATLYAGVQSEFDNRESLLETQKKQLESRIEYVNTIGLQSGIGYYQKLINLEENSLNALQKEKEQLKQVFDDAVAYGRIEIGTDTWYEQLEVLTNLDQRISDSQQSIAEYESTVRNLKWENFDLLINKFSRITSESDFLIDLLSQSKLINDDGSYTKEGTATQAQHSVNYTTYMETAKEYERAANELINATDQVSIAKREEYLDAQQKAIQSALQEKQAMIDLVKEGIQVQINAFEELIQKKKEALDSEKALYDYQKTIEGKNKDIASIQREIDIFSGDNSLENQKRLRELYSKLQNAEDDLYDTEYNHSIESQKDALDKELAEYKDSMNTYMENTEHLFLSTLEMIKAENTSVSATIQSVAKNVGYTITEEMGSAWSNASDGMSHYAATVTTQSSGILSVLNSIRLAWENVAKAAEKAASHNIDKIKDQFEDTTTTTPSKMTVENILGTKTSNTNSRGQSALNQYVTSLGYHMMGNEQILNLAKLLGVDGLNEKNLWSDNSIKLRKQLLNQLKSYFSKGSFSRGGVIQVNKDPVLRSITGEDGVALVKNNETILTEQFTDLLPLTIEEMKKFTSGNLWNQIPLNLWNSIVPMNATTSKSSNISVGEYKVEINVFNPANADAFLRELQRSSKLQRGIQAVTIDQMLGKSKYTVNQIR